MTEEAHNPYQPEEPDPEHPSPENAHSPAAESPIDKEAIDLRPADPSSAPPPSGAPVTTAHIPSTPAPPKPFPVVPPPPPDEGPVPAETEEVPEEPVVETGPATEPLMPPPPPPPAPADLGLPEKGLPGDKRKRFEALSYKKTDDETDKTARILGAGAVLVALLALFISTGLIPLNKVSSSQLADGSVTNSKLAPASVSSENLQPGVVSVGPTGAAGKIGPAGPTGASGASSQLQATVTEKKTPSTALSPKTLTAACPAGTTVVYGGARIEGSSLALANVVLQDSGPSSTAGTDWQASAINSSNKSVGNWQLVIVLSCGKTVKKGVVPSKSGTTPEPGTGVPVPGGPGTPNTGTSGTTGPTSPGGVVTP